MSSKIKNIIIALVAIAALVLIYIFFIKKSPDQASLVTAYPTQTSAPAVPGGPGTPSTGGITGANAASGTNTLITQDFLSVLLNVKNIKLNDAILTDPAFTSLVDSSITISQDGTEGRPNPFAPLGQENTPSTATPASTTSTVTPVIPAIH